MYRSLAATTPTLTAAKSIIAARTVKQTDRRSPKRAAGVNDDFRLPFILSPFSVLRLRLHRTEGAAAGREGRIRRARQIARRYRNSPIQCQVTCQPMILSAKITLFKQRINGNETKIFPILNLSVCFPSHVGFLRRIGSGQAPFCKNKKPT